MNDIFVQECGSSHAPTIVLLHGGGTSGWMWDRCASLLYDYHCLISDLPKHGRSCDIKPFTIEDSARRIADLIRDRVPGGRAHVVGHSLGGQVLVALLAMAPKVLDRVAVSSALLRLLPTARLLSLVDHALLPLLPLARNRLSRKFKPNCFASPLLTSKPIIRTP